MTPQLDPEAQALLDVMRAAGTPQPYTLPIAQARESMRATLVTKGDPIALHSAEDVSMPTPYGALALRLYRPAEGPLPLALFLHGGGWVLNDLDTHDRLCRRIARRSGWLLAALDYRRAPEHKHPAALQDAQQAYRWLLDNVARIGGAAGGGVALVGESSGATTAACLALLLRDSGAPMPICQILAYPVTDIYGRWPSCEQRGTGYMLDTEFARWSMDNATAPDQDAGDPYLLPLAADLGGLPPTFLMTAEFDPLRDEGIAYAHKLQSAGVRVEHIHVEDQMHGFLLLDRAIAKAGVLIDRLADSLAAHTP
jgi:acetyl esterase